MKKKFFLPFIFVLLAGQVRAHCPLCTAGAAVAAGGAVWLGVNEAVVGIFIGAFAVSMGLWFSRIIKRKFIPFQKTAIVLLSFLTTVIPMLALFNSSIYPLYLSYFGDYGSLFNRTYVINLFLVFSILGGILTTMTPMLSRKLSQIRQGK